MENEISVTEIQNDYTGTAASEQHELKSAEKNDGASELEELRQQVKALSEELKRKNEEAEKISAELGEFNSLFPDVSINNVPEEVWLKVREGNSLTAAYAVYYRQCQLRDEQTKLINQKNASLSAGSAGEHTSPEYFTPDEVRKMSQGEVRANYKKILNSMKKWN